MERLSTALFWVGRPDADIGGFWLVDGACIQSCGGGENRVEIRVK